MFITHAAAYFDTFIDTLESLPPQDKRVNIGIYPPPNFSGIIYNTEQLTAKHHLECLLAIVKRSPTDTIEIWDYSQVNIKILESHGLKAKHVPLKTSDTYVQRIKAVYQSRPPKYDIAFNGSISERRSKILEGLKAAGFNVLISSSWGIQRDEEIAQSRLLINIHYNTDYQIFESARCEPWLSLGFPVISETSIEDDPRCIVAKYEDLVQKTKEFFGKN